MINAITILTGFISLGLGIVGIFLPGLPSTPFLLITVFCFAKGSPRLHNWLCSTNLYKQHVSRFIIDRSMTVKTKLCILVPATAMIVVALIFSPWWQLRIFLSFLLLLKYIYFCVCIPTIAREPSEKTYHAKTIPLKEINTMQNRMKTHQLSNEQIDNILRTQSIGVIATINGNDYPYAVPVHFVLHEDKLYIHGLPKGQKIENIRSNCKVCFTVYDMKKLIMDEFGKACDTNTEYESVVVLGTATVVEDIAVKQMALDAVVCKYTPHLSNQKLPDNMIKGTCVIEIKIENCTGKYYI